MWVDQAQQLLSQYWREVIKISIRGVPFHWRRYKERYRLLGTKCEKCNNIFFPMREICPNCRRDGKPVPITFSGAGKVFTYTVIHVAPEGFKGYTPYLIGVIQLNEGPKVTSQIVDCPIDTVSIGMPVEVCFRKIREQGPHGIICYGFKFRPAHNFKAI